MTLSFSTAYMASIRAQLRALAEHARRTNGWLDGWVALYGSHVEGWGQDLDATRFRRGTVAVGPGGQFRVVAGPLDQQVWQDVPDLPSHGESGNADDAVALQRPALDGQDTQPQGTHEPSDVDEIGGEGAEPYPTLDFDQVATSEALKRLDRGLLCAYASLLEQAVTLDDVEVRRQVGATLMYHGQQLMRATRSGKIWVATPAEVHLRGLVNALLAYYGIQDGTRRTQP